MFLNPFDPQVLIGNEIEISSEFGRIVNKKSFHLGNLIGQLGNQLNCFKDLREMP